GGGEGGGRGVVRGGLVLLAVLVPAEGNVGGAEPAHRLHLAEEVVEHVAPVAQHVENDAAAVLLAVVPRRALSIRLSFLAVAFEHPVAEFAAHREDLSEKALLAQLLELEQPRQPELVLHYAVLDARLLRCRIEIPRFGATPPCLRISRIERMRCWFMPMRPVTPCMMMPTRFSFIEP